jgi:hypothetical protein
MASGSSSARALRSTGVIIGIATLAALVVGLVAGLVGGDVPRGLATWGTPVLLVGTVYAVFSAYRTGERPDHRDR